MEEKERIEMIKNTVMAFKNNEQNALNDFIKEVFDAFKMVDCMEAISDKAIAKAISKISDNENTSSPWKDFSTVHMINTMRNEWTELQVALDELLPDVKLKEDGSDEIIFHAIEPTKDELLDIINTAIFSYLTIEFHEKYGMVKEL